MIPEKVESALRQVYTLLSGTDILWALTGSTAFAAQGMPYTPPDIDILTDRAGAYAMQALLGAHTIAPVALSPEGNGYIRSHFGRFDVEGVVVEVIGDGQKRVDGVWQPPDEIAPHRRWVGYAGMCLPVMSLAFEADSYEKMNRPEKAAAIAAFEARQSRSKSEDFAGCEK